MTYRRLDIPRYHTIATGTDGWASQVIDNFDEIWPKKPCIRAYSSIAMYCPDDDTTLAEFDVERYNDGYGFYWNSNSELVPTRSGFYLISVNCDWEPSITGERIVKIIAGSQTIATDYQKPEQENGYCSHSFSYVGNFAAGVPISIGYTQTSGGTLAVNAGSPAQQYRQDLAALWIGSVGFDVQ